MRLLQLALQEGFTGIDIQQTGEGRFIHLDDIQPEDEIHVPRPWICRTSLTDPMRVK